MINERCKNEQYDRLELKKRISSLMELGEQSLERLRDKLLSLKRKLG